jgi:hypothetical protein
LRGISDRIATGRHGTFLTSTLLTMTFTICAVPTSGCRSCPICKACRRLYLTTVLFGGVTWYTCLRHRSRRGFVL